MSHLFAYVDYADAVHGWEPSGLALVDVTQDNAVLDAHREVLTAEFPRRKFETELKITVGGLRADNGSYYVGPDCSVGRFKLAELQEAHKLGLVSGGHMHRCMCKRKGRSATAISDGSSLPPGRRFSSWSTPLRSRGR